MGARAAGTLSGRFRPWQGVETRALALARSALELAVAAQARDNEMLVALRLGKDGADAARPMELTCYPTLARVNDPRATDGLTRAHTAVMAQAATITGTALRHGFLHNIPEHREIVAAWAAHGTPRPPASETP